MDVSISNDTIYVTEVDTATNWANCICYFDLCASVTGLQGSNYFVEIYRKFILYPDTLFYIGSTSFTYGGSSLVYISNTYQSDCYNITQVHEDKVQPEEFSLGQNYPNPFNPSTRISWQSPVGSWQTLKVYDALGNEVVTLVNEELPAGEYEVEFYVSLLSGSVSAEGGYASGVYFYQLKVYPAKGGAEGFVETKKMLLLK